MRLRLLALVLVAGSLPGAAWGRPISISADLGYGLLAQRDSERHGIGVGLQAHVELTPSLLVGGRATYGAHPAEGGTTHAGTVLASLIFQFDVVHWVPSVILEGGLLWSRTPGGATDSEAVIVFGVGLDRLLSRFWAVGLHVRFHLVPQVSAGFPGYLAVGPRLTFRWE